MIDWFTFIVFSGSKVVLFCVRADFNKDEVCLSFGSDNGVRGVLFNDSIQYPLVQVSHPKSFSIRKRVSG